jgi:hypothetical protein
LTPRPGLKSRHTCVVENEANFLESLRDCGDFGIGKGPIDADEKALYRATPAVSLSCEREGIVCECEYIEIMQILPRFE